MAERIKKLQYAILFERKKEFCTIIKNNSFPINEVVLSGDNNLIHYLVHSDRLNMLELAFELFEEQYKESCDKEEVYKQWLNARNDKNQTPIHLSVIGGNLVCL